MRSEEFFSTHPVFTFDEYRRARDDAGTTLSTVKNLLAGHTASGRVVRVRQGLYASVPRGVVATEFEPDPYLVASRIAPKAIVCGHAALQFFGKTYSVWSRFHCFVPERRRQLTFRGATFVPVLDPAPVRSLPDRGGGVVERPHADGTVRVSTLERTLVDVLQAPERAGGWEEVWRSLEMVEFFDLPSVEQYVRNLDSALAAARVGLFLELHAQTLLVEPGALEGFKRMAPLQPRYLDASQTRGRLNATWNLIIPEWLLARRWEEVS